MKPPEGAVAVPAVFLHRYEGARDADTFEGRVGRCYELALRAHLTWAARGWVTMLVHGTIGPKKNPHAWVEWRDSAGKRWAWDPVLDGVMPGTRYRDDYHAWPWTRYNAPQAAILSVYGNGPWGQRDVERAINAIETMMANGSDKKEGKARIADLRTENNLKGK